jgi:hypothetical protein
MQVQTLRRGEKYDEEQVNNKKKYQLYQIRSPELSLVTLCPNQENIHDEDT